MDESFATFLERVGPPIDRREIEPSPYRGRLPDRLLEYWSEHGLCGYGDGLFWTVNPAEYTGLLARWLEGTPYVDETYDVVVRTAFGRLCAWGEKTLRCLIITPENGTALRTPPSQYRPDIAVERFFASFPRGLCDSTDADDEPLFDRALESLGRLAHDEMYGYVPALALGGSKLLKNLRKVKMREHLELLASLGPLRIADFKRGTGAPQE